ncbi:Bug family tripartite tricarboxylate transporter substrate binding protein [Bosea beijingensis]|uniref:Bug family tripartite tricarboxylate transporter substrate binding protein n=1 Tax=Bosea beijingensis TaxID=3068632 RepID=UPI00274091D9|nr:tripartite tricarboxylate transporter substrate binding protein [Bosea sp. REN20]
MYRRTLLLAAAALALGLSGSAQAQNWPTQPITIVVGFQPGGVADALPRVMQEYLQAEFGQPIVVENRPGSAGAIAMAAVAKGNANHTLGVQTLQNLILPSVSSNAIYDPRKDFRGISVMASIPNILAVHPDVPAKTVPELIAYARANPGKLNWGSAGMATAPHLMLEVLKRDAKLDIEHVPYAGINQAYVDLLAGRIQAILGPYGSIKPHLPQLRALAVSTPERSAFVPDLPPMSEASGLKDFALTEWYSLIAPAKMSDEVAARIGTAVNKFLKSDKFKEFATNRGLTVVASEPAAAQTYLMKEFDAMAAVVKSANVKLD